MEYPRIISVIITHNDRFGNLVVICAVGDALDKLCGSVLGYSLVSIKFHQSQ